MHPKIAIIITSFERPDLLRKSVESVLENWCENFVILVGDQSKEDNELMKRWKIELPSQLSYVKLPFNCGLSYARNILVTQASLLGAEYCIISADSICFNSSMKRVNEILPVFTEHPYLGRIGFKLQGRINWEGWLTLNEGESFELELINTKSVGIHLFECNCIKNYFIARTESLLDVKWDDNLKMCEHEDFQYRYAKCWDTLYTDFYTGTYIGKREGDFATYRQENWINGMKYLLNKYSIRQWITYKNPELFDRSV